LASLKKEALYWEKFGWYCKGYHAKWNQRDNWKWCSDCDFYGLCVFCCQESMPLLESHQLNCAAIKERFGPFIEFGEVQN
jgi:hypothetical protein